jgi:hypothetical protein
VRPIECERRLQKAGHHVGGREASDAFQRARQLFAAQKLHRQERHLRRFVDAGIEHIDDVVAVDLRGDARLALEPLAKIGAIDKVGVHHLEGAPSLRLQVNHLVDGAHAARSDATDHLVPVGENLTRSKTRGHINKLSTRPGGSSM